METQQDIIFLSYAREDAEIAAKLYKDLSRAGHEVWFDKVSLQPGQRWKPEIKKNIRHSKYFVALLSSNSVSKTGYVQKELHEALEILDEHPESEIYIIPVRVEDCEPSHLKLNDINWVDLFPSYEEGLERLIQVFRTKQTRLTIILLQEANSVEIANAVDVANAVQTAFKFKMHPTVVSFEKSEYQLPNGAFDFDHLMDNLVAHQGDIQELLPYRPIFITSLPYSDKKMIDEFASKSLLDELSQCYYYQIFEYPQGNTALISTFIWDHLPPNKKLNLPKSPSGRRVLQPYLLFEFAAIALDPLADLPIHEETRGCPFDYCNDVREIDVSFQTRKLCAEHENYLQEQVKKGRLSKEQLDSALVLFDRAFSKST
jgi:hypothetical protein